MTSRSGNRNITAELVYHQTTGGGPRPQSLLVIPNHGSEVAYQPVNSSGNYSGGVEDMLGMNSYNYPLDQSMNQGNQQNSANYEKANYVRSLADMFACPHTTFPISVGLFSRVATKSQGTYLFQLVDELSSLTQSSMTGTLEISPILFLLPIGLALFLGYVFGMITGDWKIGLAVGIVVLLFIGIMLSLIIFGSRVQKVHQAIVMGVALNRFLQSFTLFFSLIFCYPPEDTTENKPIKIIFTHQNLSMYPTSAHGIVALVEKVSQGTERYYNCFITRIYRSLTDIYSGGERKFKRICCCPSFVLIIIITFAVIVNGTLIRYYNARFVPLFSSRGVAVVFVLFTCILFLGFISSVPVISRVLIYLIRSPSAKLKAIVDSANAESESAEKTMKLEFKRQCEMISAMDNYLGDRNTRIVVCVDASDTFNREKLVKFIHLVHNLMITEPTAPLAVVIAADFQAILGDIEPETVPLAFSDSFHLVHTTLHLPIFMEDPCFSPSPQNLFSSSMQSQNRQPPIAANGSFCLRGGASFESLSTAVSGIRYPQQRIASPPPPAPPSMLQQHSGLPVAGCAGANSAKAANKKAGSGPKTITELYIGRNELSDINNKMLKHLVAATAFTGRLLRINQIEFKIEDLVVWLTYALNWPFQAAWLIIYLEDHLDRLDQRITLNQLHEIIAPKIARSEEQVKELRNDDRDPEKLINYMQTDSGTALTLGHIQRLCACSPFLNPYLRQAIRDIISKFENTPKSARKVDAAIHSWSPDMGQNGRPGRSSSIKTPPNQTSSTTNILHGSQQQLGPDTSSIKAAVHRFEEPVLPAPQSAPLSRKQSFTTPRNSSSADLPKTPSTVRKCLVRLKNGYPGKDLSQLNMEEVCDTLAQIEGLSESRRQAYQQQLTELNITGLVLSVCDMDQLRPELGMTFGDWQLFHTLILHLRRLEAMHEEEGGGGSSDAEIEMADLAIASGEILMEEEDNDLDSEIAVWKKKKRQKKKKSLKEEHPVPQLPTLQHQTSSLAGSTSAMMISPPPLPPKQQPIQQPQANFYLSNSNPAPSTVGAFNYQHPPPGYKFAYNLGQQATVQPQQQQVTVEAMVNSFPAQGSITNDMLSQSMPARAVPQAQAYIPPAGVYAGGFATPSSMSQSGSYVLSPPQQHHPITSHMTIGGVPSGLPVQTSCQQHPQLSVGEAVALLITENRPLKEKTRAHASQSDLTPNAKRRRKLKLVRSLSQSRERIQMARVYSTSEIAGPEVVEYRRFIPVIYNQDGAADDWESESECTCEYWYRLDKPNQGAGSEPGSLANSRPVTSPEMSDDGGGGDDSHKAMSTSSINQNSKGGPSLPTTSQQGTSGLVNASSGIAIENNTNCEM